ncbi:S41 family peptidase [Flavobacterium sp. GCM10027622]|uniref:S41 family peptidase n=1 Tax=unclassified Flavobacterium TaxID=196869 RepID=UPI00361B0073
MKRLLVLLAFFFFQFINAETTLTEPQKLTTTCKVWGFLKYYHPKVANGDFNWNTQLLENLPKIEQAKNKKEFSLVLENWINSLGDLQKTAPILPKEKLEYFDKNFDLSWLDDSKMFTKSLSEKLKFIEKNRFQGEHFYVGKHMAGNIFIKNEDFTNFNSMDKNDRILALFTYWNLIEYFFPYKYVMDVKWDATLEQMIPRFCNAQTEDEFYLTMQALTAKINDSHVVFYRYTRRHFLPMVAKIIDNKMIVTEILNPDLTESNGVKVGDIITKINDKSIEQIIAEKRDLISASNDSRFLHDIIEPILSGKEDTIKLEFLTDGKYLSKTINWADYNQNRYVLKSIPKYKASKVKFKQIENNIGYVNMAFLHIKDIPEMIEKLQSTKAIVFDLRNYPNGTYEAISAFINSKEKLFAVYTAPDLSYPGRFFWQEGTTSGTQNNNNYKGKVIVLIDEASLSQSEWTAMCFQTADNTTLIGSQTAGADGNVTDIDYMKAFHSSFTGLGVYYPDRRETQRIGIIPDIAIKPTIKGMLEGKDEVLERALQFIETGK